MARILGYGGSGQPAHLGPVGSPQRRATGKQRDTQVPFVGRLCMLTRAITERHRLSPLESITGVPEAIWRQTELVSGSPRSRADDGAKWLARRTSRCVKADGTLRPSSGSSSKDSSTITPGLVGVKFKSAGSGRHRFINHSSWPVESEMQRPSLIAPMLLLCAGFVSAQPGLLPAPPVVFPRALPLRTPVMRARSPRAPPNQSISRLQPQPKKDGRAFRSSGLLTGTGCSLSPVCC